MVAGVVIGITSEFFTGDDKKPVANVAKACQSGPAFTILSGFSYGLWSTLPSMAGIGLAALLSFRLGGMLGIAVAALGMLKPYLMLGTVVKPQGVRGEVKVHHETGDPQRFLDLETVYRKQGEAYQPLKVLSARVNGDDVFITLEGVNDRDAAEALRGAELYIDREHD